MFTIICGAALVAVSSATFWHLSPRNGQVHPLIQKFDGGSTITLAIMTVFTTGILMMFAPFLG
jgi:type IV secretory pathway VirB2 component (pilin)